MRVKKFFCTVLACMIAMNCFIFNAGAVEQTAMQEAGMNVARASGRFSMDVKGNTAVKASTSFPLEIGEVVTIKASYSPFSSDVDFGVIAPDGLFYSVNVTDGSVDWSLKVSQRGTYTLAVRNNSNETISVSGYVNY